jgi:hypothetical protein
MGGNIINVSELQNANQIFGGKRFKCSVVLLLEVCTDAAYS